MTRKDEKIKSLEDEIACLKIAERQGYAHSPTLHQMKIATLKDLLKRGNTHDAFYITVAVQGGKEIIKDMLIRDFISKATLEALIADANATLDYLTLKTAVRV